MHGGDVYGNKVDIDMSVSLNPYCLCGEDEELKKTTEDAIAEGIAGSVRYPDISQRTVRAAIGDAVGIGPECVFAGCGASELIMAAVGFTAPKRVLIVEPAFSGYMHALKTLRDCSVQSYIPGEEGAFTIDDGLFDAIDDGIDMLFLSDPGNPSGKNIDERMLEKIIRFCGKRDIRVLLDESFLTISRAALSKTRLKLTGKTYPNVFVIRSLTKCLALPGIRMGYVLADAANIEGIRRFLPEWNLPAVSECVIKRGVKTVTGREFIEKSLDMIEKEKEYVEKNLTEAGFTVYDSDTVYMLFRGKSGLYEKLLKKGILIRKCDDFRGLDETFYRIAVRTHSDNERFVSAVKDR